jgi:hypothetical protein
MSYRVHKSTTGNVVVASREDDFIASFKDGVWLDRLAFSAHELEDLLLVTDQSEADSLIAQAKNALSHDAIVA